MNHIEDRICVHLSLLIVYTEGVASMNEDLVVVGGVMDRVGLGCGLCRHFYGVGKKGYGHG